MKSKFYIVALCSFAVVLASASVGFGGAVSADDVWTKLDGPQMRLHLESASLPDDFQTVSLDKNALRSILGRAPAEFTRGPGTILMMPMPDGSFQRFRIEHSLVVERGLLEKYPELGATFRGHGVDDPTASARFDLLPDGFHAMILSGKGTVIIDPSGPADTYISYSK